MSDLPTGSGVDLIVEDFKCLRGEHRFELRGLTVLAGANSSGKSSAVQPVLLLKQTLQSQIDPPGPLLLDGPLIAYSEASEIVWRREPAGEFVAGIGLAGGDVTSRFSCTPHGLQRRRCVLRLNGTDSVPALVDLDAAEPGESARRALAGKPGVPVTGDRTTTDGVRYELRPARFALEAWAVTTGTDHVLGPWDSRRYAILAALIHVPGFRGNPERRYRLAAATQTPSGRFASEYAAGFLLAWQQTDDHRLGEVSSQLSAMDLTGHVEVVQNDGVSVSILVGRLPSNGRKTKDLVNIADVGFGVSQVLPVLVALLAAEPGQIVHLEQPELHLHPEAQARLGQVIVEAVRRGVLVILETHSPLLLLAIQIALASGEVAPEKVRLYWFERDAKGAAKVTPGRLDEQGRYDQWPVDFWEVERQRYGQYVHTFMQAPGQAAG